MIRNKHFELKPKSEIIKQYYECTESFKKNPSEYKDGYKSALEYVLNLIG